MHFSSFAFTNLIVIPSLILSCISISYANTAEQVNTTVEMDIIEIKGVRSRLNQIGVLKDSIAKTELIDAQQIKDRQADNLTAAIASTIGIRVSNECSMCGAKRVMINGLKGEHTNVLVDGIPVHTMISGFYGLDAVAMSGIGEIEIARGAGASLTAPEAIGGVINLVSKTPTKDQMELDVSVGESGYKKAAFMLSGLNDNQDLAGSFIVQYDKRD